MVVLQNLIGFQELLSSDIGGVQILIVFISKLSFLRYKLLKVTAD
jgi:hypothetical protein